MSCLPGREADVGAFAGDLRCELPWPIASDTVGMVLVQHAAEEVRDPRMLLDECARVLVPGGTLWLSVLNPLSPFRGRWWRGGLHASALGTWQSRLRRSGLVPDSLSVQWLGPYWRTDRHDSGVAARDRLRAAVAITVVKRVHAAIPRQPLMRFRLQAGGVGSASMGRSIARSVPGRGHGRGG
ncbi:methyltransferase domain-containing protein [Lysobacter sp. A3-1-A15]|uniref:methyltransferase domain-containing protein n=1 Tax=Novilysobacter viscosus TaxID=3098602 RepID=UPI002EDB3093